MMMVFIEMIALRKPIAKSISLFTKVELFSFYLNQQNNMSKVNNVIVILSGIPITTVLSFFFLWGDNFFKKEINFISNRR